MKKVFKHTGMLLGIVFCFCFLLNLSAKAAEVTYDISQMEPFRSRTQQEIARDYEETINSQAAYVDRDEDSYYDVVPSLKAPYTGGQLKASTHQIMTNMTNFYRRLIGVSEIPIVSKHSNDLQVGAVCRNFEFAHALDDAKKPVDMEDSFWQQGANATHNILAMGYTPRGSITGWLDEGYSLRTGTFDTIGHRQMLLSYKTTGMDFGYAGNIAIGNRLGANGTTSLPYVTFPAAGYCLNNVVGVDSSAWSIELNKDVFPSVSLSKLTLTVTNENTGESYICSQSNGRLSYDYDAYMFKQPEIEESRYTDTYRVEMTGLTDKDGKTAMISYEIRFFDYRDYVESSVTRVSVKDGYSSYSVSASYAQGEYLTYIGKALPRELTVTAENGKSCTIPIEGQWILDEQNKCWYCKGDTTQLPENFVDEDNRLEKVRIPYDIENYTGSLYASPSSCIEGQSGTLTVNFYMLNSQYNALYQVHSDGTVSKRYDEQSGNYQQIVGETYIEGGRFSVENYQCSDTGTYFAIYAPYAGGSAYVTPFANVTVSPREVTSIVVSSSPQNTYWQGADIDLNGAQLTVSYNDDTTETVALQESMISGFMTEEPGEKTASIFYGGKTTAFSYLVAALPENVTAIYGQTLADVGLPATEIGRYAFESETVSVGNVGEHSFAIVFVPAKSSYKTLTGKSITVAVEKANPVYVIPTGLTAVYGQTLQDVELPSDNKGTFSFEAPDTTSVGDAGERIFAVSYTPVDTANYNVITGIKVTITVAKAQAQSLTPPTVSAVTYDPSRTLNDISLPVGWSWDEPETIPVVSNDGYKATYTPSDEEAKNYDYSGITLTYVLSLNVQKAGNAPNMPESTMEVANEVKSLEKISLPFGWSWQDVSGKGIPAGGTVTGTAIYYDTKNYENYTAEITVARAACDVEQAQLVVDEEPTCIAAGKGHKICLLCGDVVEENVVIASDPNRHQYEDGICVLCGHQKQFVQGQLSYTAIQYEDGSGVDSTKAAVSVKAVDKEISGDIVIPKTVEEDGVSYTVLTVEANAFAGCANISSVTVPESVNDIGNHAFSHCNSLLSVTFAGTQAPEMADNAFAESSSEMTIYIPENAEGYEDNLALSDKNIVVIKDEKPEEDNPGTQTPGTQSPGTQNPTGESGSDSAGQGNNSVGNYAPSKTLAPVKVSKIILSGISKQIAAGKKVKLTAEVKPDHAKNKKIIWSSSNPKVAKVSQNGVVKVMKNAGGKKVTIFATASDGSNAKAAYVISVKKGVVKKIAVTGSKTRTVKAGKAIKLKVRVQATAKANKKIKWVSSNERYATVTSSGKVKTFKNAKGKKVKITAMATDGSNKKAVYKIKIK